jgi:hypothetical protein
MAQFAPQTAQEARSGPETRKLTHVRACVRCGTEPRADEVFLCLTCLDSPTARREIREAVATVVDGQAQRAWLVAHRHWVGGWSIRRGGTRA